MPTDLLQRDGFGSAFGRFFAMPGRVELVDSALLKEMFLPKLRPAGNKLLRDHRHFVRGQLKHYGVDYDESKLTGNGTALFKKLLADGKVRMVPAFFH